MAKYEKRQSGCFAYTCRSAKFVQLDFWKQNKAFNYLKFDSILNKQKQDLAQ